MADENVIPIRERSRAEVIDHFMGEIAERDLRIKEQDAYIAQVEDAVQRFRTYLDFLHKHLSDARDTIEMALGLFERLQSQKEKS